MPLLLAITQARRRAAWEVTRPCGQSVCMFHRDLGVYVGHSMGSSEMSGRPDYPWRDSRKKPVEPTSGLGPMYGRGRRSGGRDRLNANRRPDSPDPDPAGHSRLTSKEKGSHGATYCDLPKWCCVLTQRLLMRDCAMPRRGRPWGPA